MRWSRLGVFDKIFTALASEDGTPDEIMIDSTHLPAGPACRRGRERSS
jgi:putative transposase